jgi:hypothetical protein
MPVMTLNPRADVNTNVHISATSSVQDRTREMTMESGAPGARGRAMCCGFRRARGRLQYSGIVRRVYYGRGGRYLAALSPSLFVALYMYVLYYSQQHHNNCCRVFPSPRVPTHLTLPRNTPSALPMGTLLALPRRHAAQVVLDVAAALLYTRLARLVLHQRGRAAETH